MIKPIIAPAAFAGFCICFYFASCNGQVQPIMQKENDLTIDKLIEEQEEAYFSDRFLRVFITNDDHHTITYFHMIVIQFRTVATLCAKF